MSWPTILTAVPSHWLTIKCIVHNSRILPAKSLVPGARPMDSLRVAAVFDGHFGTASPAPLCLGGRPGILPAGCGRGSHGRGWECMIFKGVCLWFSCVVFLTSRANCYPRISRTWTPRTFDVFPVIVPRYRPKIQIQCLYRLIFVNNTIQPYVTGRPNKESAAS